MMQQQVLSADICVLAESYLKPSVCGHSIPFKQWIRSAVTANRCPICQHPVTYIADGVSASFLDAMDDKKSQMIGNSESFVYFKYGKLSYRLSVPNASSSRRQDWSDRWMQLFSWTLRRSFTPTTAQLHIASCLSISLQHMKILYKGKILYPVSAPFTETSLSDYLMELSSTNRKGPPVLLVVGTPIPLQEEMLSFEKQQQQSNPKDIWTAVRTARLSDVIPAIQWMIRFSIRCSLQIFSCIRESVHCGWKFLCNGGSGPERRTHPRID